MNGTEQAPRKNAKSDNGRARKPIDKKKILLIAVTVLLCLAAIVTSVLLVRRFMKVGKFEVVGITLYEPEEIISASGIKYGDRLYGMNEEEIEKRMLQECPYLESVEIEVRFPKTCKLKVVGKTPEWYLDISGTKYALDSKLVVISETAKTEGMTKLILPHIQTAMYGEVPLFADSETERKKTLEIIAEVRQSSLKPRLTMLNAESRLNLFLEVDGAYFVDLGDMSDLSAKLNAVEAVLEQESVKNNGEGTITIVKGQGGYTAAFSPLRAE